MKTNLAVLLFGICTLCNVSAEPFTASSLKTGFAVTGDLSGDISIRSQAVIIRLSRGLIIREPMGSAPSRKIIGISAFLAEWTPDKKTFRPIAYSKELPLKRIIGIGESISIDGAEFEIPTAQLSRSQIKDFWLGFSILVQVPSEDNKGQIGTCYVHTTSFLGGGSTGFPPKRE